MIDATQQKAAPHGPPITTIADFLADAVDAARFPQHILRFRNDRSAAEIGLESLNDDDWIAHFGRFAPLPDNLPRPLALRYHGHQFGHYNPDIGDGRGFLFAQLRDDRGRWIDLGTKGSGQTPYSRFGDGRLTLKGAVREMLATEMLEALGVPTSRTLSVIETGEALERNDEPSPTRGAVLVRQSHSHIRIGSFQRLAALDDRAALEQLVRYVLVHLHHESEADFAALSVGDAAALMLANAVARCADLAASYMVAGFVHGVLNTDNINVTGESFDYGPWRFAPTWDAGFVAAYFDHQGRYAFGRQPQVMHWNLGQLAIALRPLCESAPLVTALETFGGLYQAALARRFLWRLGYASQGLDADSALIAAAERYMVSAAIKVDRFFFDWARGGSDDAAPGEIREAWTALLSQYAPCATRDAPYWQRAEPCSMLIEEVEQIWSAIADHDDWQPLHDKVDDIRAMGQALAID